MSPENTECTFLKISLRNLSKWNRPAARSGASVISKEQDINDYDSPGIGPGYGISLNNT